MQSTNEPSEMDSDEEKWANIMGDDEQNNHENNPHAMICLKQIPPEEFTLHQPIKPTKKLKKSMYFVSDANTTLTNEDIQYQLLNTADTLATTPIRDIFKETKTKLDKFDKLVKVPERSLSSTLEHYYSKNLKQSETFPNTFDISYEEIQKDVEQDRNYQKGEKTPRFYNFIKSEPFDDGYIMTTDDFPPSVDHPRLRPGGKTNKINSVLENIDNDFKPTIFLTTKTYTRSKKKS